MHVTKETTGFVLIYIIVCNNESIKLTVYGSSDINHCGVGDSRCNVIQGKQKNEKIYDTSFHICEEHYSSNHRLWNHREWVAESSGSWTEEKLTE